MNMLKINGNDVEPNRKYSIAEAAIIVGYSGQTLRNARKRTDDRRLEVGVRRNNGLLCVKGIDLFHWADGLITDPRKSYKSFKY